MTKAQASGYTAPKHTWTHTLHIYAPLTCVRLVLCHLKAPMPLPTNPHAISVSCQRFSASKHTSWIIASCLTKCPCCCFSDHSSCLCSLSLCQVISPWLCVLLMGTWHCVPCPSRAYHEEACHIKLFSVAEINLYGWGRSKYQIPHLVFICVFICISM